MVSIPSRPTKNAITHLRQLRVQLNLSKFLLLEPLSLSEATLPVPVTQPKRKQLTLHQYLTKVSRPMPPPAPVSNRSLLEASQTSPLPRTVRCALIRYTNKPRRARNRITRYTVSLPTYDLFDSWGNSLEPIEVNTTFRVFLQSPNGFSLDRNNHLLMQDLQTCHQYGAGVLCFPETKVNWDEEGQIFTLQQLLKGIWKSSMLQPSHTPELFLSTYQPGGTLTAVCENWVSRVVARGEDPYGLGRWSYITLRGQGDSKISIVTAYQACQSSGDGTYYQQQLRLLSRLHHELNIVSLPAPRRQLILDLQAWLEALKSEGHHFILSMDANESFDPDHAVAPQPLPYSAPNLTVHTTHPGKLATLVASCDLFLPLGFQHPTRPFPESHIRGRNQIDFILVSKAILPAVLRSGVMSHHSLTRGDHHPYYLDFDASKLFSDPAYTIEPASVRKWRLQDPRVVIRNIAPTYVIVLLLITFSLYWRNSRSS